MINVKEKEKEFYERRENNPPENVATITYKNGSGCMIINMDNFYKLPKSKQNKIMKLMEGNK